jgi:2-polyprenyl-3-methyl-5-hydroxy-6-metoxy-1,4-benzoquinol methylase
MSQGPVPVEEQVAFYDEWNEKYRNADFEHIELLSRARAAKVLEIVSALRLPDPAIIEVGCGTGWLSRELCRHGRVTGVDLSPKAIEIARKLAPDAEFASGDFMAMDLRERFDLVVCLETIFYVADQNSFMKQIVDALRPGGYAVITAVNTFVYERCTDVAMALQRGQVRQWLPRRDLRRLLSAHLTIRGWTTALPRGNLGVLRIVNSTKLNALLATVFAEETIRRAKESWGLGHTHVVLLQKTAAS